MNQGGWKHHMILPDIEITSQTTARGTWTLTAFDGWYEDRYAKEDGRWKVQWTHVHLSDAALQAAARAVPGTRTIARSDLVTDLDSGPSASAPGVLRASPLVGTMGV